MVLLILFATMFKTFMRNAHLCVYNCTDAANMYATCNVLESWSVRPFSRRPVNLYSAQRRLYLQLDLEFLT